MAGATRIRGGRWPLYAVVAVVAIGAVVGSMVMERRTLERAVDEKAAAADALVTRTVQPILAGADFSHPVGEGRSTALFQALDKPLSGAMVRLRVYARDGQLVFSTDEGDRIGSVKTGDADAIRAGTAGATTTIVDDDRVSLKGEGAQSYELLQVYGPIEDAGKVAAVAELDLKYKPLVAASKQPWRTSQLVAGFLAVLFLELALFGLARATATKRLAARSGFAAAPRGKTTEPKGKPSPAETKAPGQEAEIRKALEDQLATLRTQMKKQEEDATAAAREFAEQLKATALRADQSEQKLAAAGDGAAAKAAVERATLLEQRLRQFEHQQQELQARTAELQHRLAEAERRAEEAERRLEEAAVQADPEPAPTVAPEAQAEPESEAEPAPESEAPTSESNVAEDDASVEPSAETEAVPEPSRGRAALALEAAASTVRGADQEDAHVALERAAASLFPSVVAGQVKGAEVADALVTAAAHVGIEEEEARRVIASAFVARRSA